MGTTDAIFDSSLRIAFGFHNPNHAAALLCAFASFLWGWRRGAWSGRVLAAALAVAVALTRSRTGLLVLALEWATFHVLSDGWRLPWRRRSFDGVCAETPSSSAVGDVTSRIRNRAFILAGATALAAFALAWVWPRLALDGSVLNRPKIWLAGLRLFAANPDGVGMGNSGAVASAFLLPDVPDVRTLVNAHLTFLVEFGRAAGLAWFAALAFALTGIRRRPRSGVAFAGLALSAAASTVFDWPVLLDADGFGGLGALNWVLSWTTLLLFVGLGVRLAISSLRGADARRLSVRAAAAIALAGGFVFAASRVQPGTAPAVRDGFAIRGPAPRTLALYSAPWRAVDVLARVEGPVALPVRSVSRLPRGFNMDEVSRVVLFGDCREWAGLVAGVPVVCVDE